MDFLSMLFIFIASSWIGNAKISFFSLQAGDVSLFSVPHTKFRAFSTSGTSQQNLEVNCQNKAPLQKLKVYLLGGHSHGCGSD